MIELEAIERSAQEALLRAKKAFYASLKEQGQEGAYYGLRLTCQLLNEDTFAPSGKEYEVRDNYDNKPWVNEE